MQKQAQISCAVNVPLISACVFMLHVYIYIYSTIPLLSKSKISSLKPPSVALQPCLCQTWSESQKASFLMTQLIYMYDVLEAGSSYHELLIYMNFFFCPLR